MKEKSIKAQIKEIKEQIETIKSDTANNEELAKLRKAYYEKKDELYKEECKKTESLYKKIDELAEAYGKELKKKREEIPEKIKEFVSNVSRGTDYGPKGLVVIWWSEDNRFVIVTQPGSTGWCGRGETKYYPSKHYLCDSSKINENKYGFSAFQESIIEEIEGRLSKEQKQKWQQKAEDLS